MNGKAIQYIIYEAAKKTQKGEEECQQHVQMQSLASRPSESFAKGATILAWTESVSDVDINKCLSLF